MFKKIIIYFYNQNFFSVILLTLITNNVFYLLPGNFKLAFILALGCLVLFFLITKDLFVSLLCMFVISGHYFLPGKFSTVELVSGNQFSHDLYRMGLLEEFGLTTSDIFAFWLLVILSVSSLKSSLSYLHSKKSKVIPYIIKNLFAFIIGISWTIYFSLSLISSLYYSLFPQLSLIIWLQSFKLVIIFLGILYLLEQRKKFVQMFFHVLGGILLYQNVIGLLQLLFFDINTGISNSHFIVEENLAFSRVQGIMGYGNTHGLMISMLYCIAAPFLYRKNSSYFYILSILTFINIVFSQSRSVWLALIINFFLIAFVYRANFEKRLRSINFKIYFYFFILGLVSLIVIIPRLYLSIYFLNDDGGGKLRMDMLNEGLKATVYSPLVGFGLGTNVPVMATVAPDGYIKDFPFPIHFVPLQMVLESGFIATACFFWPFYLVFRYIVKLEPDNKNTKLYLGVLSSLVVVVIYYCFQPSNINRREFLLLGIILSVAVYVQSKYKDETKILNY